MCNIQTCTYVYNVYMHILYTVAVQCKRLQRYVIPCVYLGFVSVK